MSAKMNALARCIDHRDARGCCPPVVTGAESEEQLRELVLQISTNCSALGTGQQCPFQLLAGLSWSSLRTTLDQMKHSQLLGLFELEGACCFRVLK